jgi:GDP-L-fucose synthase
MSNLSNKRISITGGEGFLGQHLIKALKKRDCKIINVVSHKDYDLVKSDDVKKMYSIQKPDIVFHLAAAVGGIEINQKNPGKFFYENAVMNLQIIHEGFKNQIEKIISAGTVSCYPNNSPLPFTEENIWNGFPEEANAPYGIAKRIMHVQSVSYKKQYNFNSIVLFLTNLYGPKDNFDENSSHVIAALIKRFYEAKKNGLKKVVIWGDGTATRDFCFVDDIAEGIVLAAEKYNSSSPLNLASGRENTIKEMALIIKEKIQYEGDIIWDIKKPTGPKRRYVNIDKAKNLIGYKINTSLEEGLEKTIKWYRDKNS